MIRSGGVFYHLRACRFEKALWGQHQEAVRAFLQAWNPKSKKIILIGPSGGYALPLGWLKRFEQVEAFEPDPLARVLFERRHGIKPQWRRQRFPFQEPDALRHLPGPEGAVLFCNLLGQIPIPNPRALRKSMEHHLAAREWASYHDALSGDEIEFDLEEARPERAGISQMRKWIYVKNPTKESIQVNSHPAPELFPEKTGRSYRYWQWRITPLQTHLIEGVFDSPESVSGAR